MISANFLSKELMSNSELISRIAGALIKSELYDRVSLPYFFLKSHPYMEAAEKETKREEVCLFVFYTVLATMAISQRERLCVCVLK